MAPCAVVSGKRHEIGGHDSADRAFEIIDQLANGRLALRIEQRQNFFAAMVGQAINKRDCIVGVGANDQPPDLLVVDQLENIRQKLRRQLFKRFVGPPRREKNTEELSHL